MTIADRLYWQRHRRQYDVDRIEDDIRAIRAGTPAEARRMLAGRLRDQVRYFARRPDALPEWRDAAAIRDLDSSKFTIRQAASLRLEELAPRVTGPLAAALEKKPPLEVRRRIEQLFREIYAAAPQLQPSPRLPYGVQWEVQHVDPCPGCGQGFLPHGSRLFLSFIANKPKDQK